MKVSAIVVALAALHPLVVLWARTPGAIGRQAADFHTAFNIAVAVAGLVGACR